MRIIAVIAAGTLSWLASAAAAQEPDIHVDVPARSGLELNVVERDLAVGQSTGWHIHHGVEIAYVLSGQINVQMRGGPIRHVERGDYFEIERDVPHVVTNGGNMTARLLISYLKDKTAPRAIDVPRPAVQ